MIAVTTSSSPIARKALYCSETPGGSPARPGLTGSWKARRKAVAPIPSSKPRRLGPATIPRPELVSTVFMASRSLLTEMLRGVRDRGADARIGAASTDVAAHCGVDVITRGLRVGLEQRYRRHDLTRLAVATLGDIVLDPGRLDRFRHGSGDCFDRRDLAVPDVCEKCLTRADRLAIHVHGARTTECLPTAEFRSFET